MPIDETPEDGNAAHADQEREAPPLTITEQHASFLASLKAEVATLDPNVGLQLRAALEYVEEAGVAIARHYAEQEEAKLGAQGEAPAPATADVAKVAATDEAAKTSG